MLYKRLDKPSLLIVVVYLDDLLITGSSLSTIMELKRNMAIEFEMSDLGKLTYYLSIEVHQFDGGITLKHSQYAMKILEESGMGTCNLTHVPMDFNVKLSKSHAKKKIDETEYRRNIGCLRYLLHTRPDLSFSVGLLSRYIQQPKESHGAALKQILRYVRGTTSLGLMFTRSAKLEVVRFSDSSHNVDEDDGKSTTGHIYYLDDSSITWCSQKKEHYLHVRLNSWLPQKQQKR